MYSFHQIEFLVISYANALPLDVFSFLGSFIEEMIPPIPAALILTTAGSIAFQQNHSWLFLFWLAVTGSAGKILASWIFYVLGDKFEDIVVVKFGKFVGIRHQDVESLGKRFSGGWGEGIGFFLFRCVPIFPSVSVSIVCGIIRLNMRVFILATFFGTIVKSLLYLYAGYAGLQAIHFVVRRIHHINFWLGIIFVIVSAGLIYWLVGKKKSNAAGEVKVH
jgi:membrane protein DedA with SNARE-associated domain